MNGPMTGPMNGGVGVPAAQRLAQELAVVASAGRLSLCPHAAGIVRLLRVTGQDAVAVWWLPGTSVLACLTCTAAVVAPRDRDTSCDVCGMVSDRVVGGLGQRLGAVGILAATCERCLNDVEGESAAIEGVAETVEAALNQLLDVKGTI